ncbi:hypothetical protein RD055328_13110 [Companilactobacillus sp. RD055328]|uniref:hypothetical protein n=1 Tax=Companilactobacillus sp. RD055328 TaxID=2916634 RepID=UPI001FC7C3B4|nr:hypothetical protein [Companilactobacillus sp. RD055328]GKQ43388.1 hypothetical protein RD055328_13110 [Companilactobacillus sp. RD055328]
MSHITFVLGLILIAITTILFFVLYKVRSSKIWLWISVFFLVILIVYLIPGIMYLA